MSVVAIAIVGSAVISYAASDNASNKAEDASNNATSAAATAAAKGEVLGYAQLEESKRQYDLATEANKPIIAAQIAAMEQSLAQAKDYDAYNKETFRPMEKKLADDAANFSTEAYAEGEASKAAADVAGSAANMRGQTARSMAAMGVNPNSAKFVALQGENDLATAGASASAKTNARKGADALGWAKRMDVVGLGRNLPGASNGAYNTAVSAGNSAAANGITPGTNYVAGMNTANNTIMAGRGLITNAANIANSNANATANSANAAFGNVVGTGIGYYAMKK